MPRGKAFPPLVLLSHWATLHSGLLTITKIDTFNGEYKMSIYARPSSSLQSIYSFNQNANHIIVLYPAHVRSFCRQFTFPLFFFPPPSSCLAALFPYQEAVRLESNFNRIRVHSDSLCNSNDNQSIHNCNPLCICHVKSRANYLLLLTEL